MKKQLILVIEDDLAISSLLEFMLQREGYEVLIAADGRMGENLLNSLLKPPELVLLDLTLPYIDGMKLLQKIRAKHLWANVPVMILTSSSLECDIVRAFQQGASDYIVKPFFPAEIMARVERYTKQNLLKQ